MLPSSVPTIVESEFFVNCGERTASYTDSSENVWEPDESGSQPLYRDTLYTIGTTTADIDGTEDDTIFKSDRWINGNQLWTFPAAPDNYEVTLYFAEIYSPFDVAGKRNFTVLIEGTQVLYQYDIVADVGQYNASIKTFPVTVADNDLTIELIKVRFICAMVSLLLLSSYRLCNCTRGFKVKQNPKASKGYGCSCCFDA